MLGIIANCCGYSHHLDFTALGSKNYDLHAAILTLILLNGEILSNNDTDDSPYNGTVLDLLDILRFRNFDVTVDIKEYT